MEHTAHVGYIGRIEAAETIDSRQSVTDIEHLPHVLCGACIPSRQIQGRELIVPTEDAVEVRHLRCIEAAQIQRLDIIQIIEHGLHVRDVGGIQLIQSGKGRQRGKSVERTRRIRICHNLSGPVTGQNELLPIRALHHIGHNGLILCGRSIPGLDFISGSGIAILQLNLGNGRLRCTAGIPRILRIQLRRGLTGHNHRLPGRRLMIGPLRHLHGDVGRTGTLLRHGDLIAIHLHRCDRGLIGRRGNGAVTGTSHGNRPGRIVQRNRHLCGCNKQRSGRLPDLPRDTLGTCGAVLPRIPGLRCKLCSVSIGIYSGCRSADRHLRRVKVIPRRRLLTARIGQYLALHRQIQRQTPVIIRQIVDAGVFELCHTGTVCNDECSHRHRYTGIRCHVERAKACAGRRTLRDRRIRRQELYGRQLRTIGRHSGSQPIHRGRERQALQRLTAIEHILAGTRCSLCHIPLGDIKDFHALAVFKGVDIPLTAAHIPLAHIQFSQRFTAIECVGHCRHTGCIPLAHVQRDQLFAVYEGAVELHDLPGVGPGLSANDLCQALTLPEHFIESAVPVPLRPIERAEIEAGNVNGLCSGTEEHIVEGAGTEDSSVALRPSAHTAGIPCRQVQRTQTCGILKGTIHRDDLRGIPARHIDRIRPCSRKSFLQRGQAVGLPCMQIQHRSAAIGESEAHIRHLLHIPAGHIQRSQASAVREDTLQRSHIGGIPTGDIQCCQRTAAVEHTVRRLQALGIPTAQVQAGQAIGVVEHIHCGSDLTHIPVLNTHDLFSASLRYFHRQRITGPIALVLPQIRLGKGVPVFHSRGVAGIVQRSVDGLNVRHVAEQPIGIGIRHDLHTVTGDDQGPIVFQPCDNGLILRGRNVPHVIVLFHQSASIAGLHIGDRIVSAGILEHNALDLGPVFRSVEVHIAVVIRCQGRCIQRLGHTVSGPGIVIAPNNRRHTPLIRNPVIALRNGVFSHDLGRYIGVYIEGARGASRSGEGNVGLGRLVKGDLCQLIDMSEGHGIKVGQRCRQRQRRNTDIIEGPLSYRHQALR